MYTYNTRVSYSRLDKNQVVPIYEIMNLMQDCSTFQSEDLGVGVDYLTSKNMAWILIAYRVKVIKNLKLGQEICVGTSPTDFKGLMATRQFFIKDMEGNFLVKAETVWVKISLDTREITRIEPSDVEKYEPQIVFDDVKVKRKIKLSSERKALTPFKVLKTYIDNNGHMNNANYIRAAEEFIDDSLKYKEVLITYNKEAMEGDMIYPFISEEENGIGICFENESGEVNSKMLFQK